MISCYKCLREPSLIIGWGSILCQLFFSFKFKWWWKNREAIITLFDLLDFLLNTRFGKVGMHGFGVENIERMMMIIAG